MVVSSVAGLASFWLVPVVVALAEVVVALGAVLVALFAGFAFVVVVALGVALVV